MDAQGPRRPASAGEREILPAGKVPWERIAELVRSDLPPRVLLGPGHGHDAALVRMGTEVWAVASDPISFTSSNAGRLAVLVNANDVAVMGARPALFTAVVLVAPGQASTGEVEQVLRQIRDTCQELDVALVGGHTEVTPGLPHTMVAGTMLGPVTSRILTSGGLRPGHRVGLTKWAGLEGTAILLAELGGPLRERLGPEPFAALGTAWLSVVPEARLAAGCPAVSALHDVTEGGVAEALYELACASGCQLQIDAERIPVLPETRIICQELQMNPLGLLGSGALLVGCAEEGAADLERAMAQRGITLSWIGRAAALAGKEQGEPPSSSLPRFPRDEILRAYLMEGMRAVVFDMDGTLVDSRYDWAAIRRRLGVTRGTILDELGSLPEPRRTEKLDLLQQIEAEATQQATLHEGSGELLELLRSRGLRTALVTNNTGANTRLLLERWDLRFDVVLTRDSGLWKPSAAPVAEAIRRLGLPAGQCLMVGDSAQDLQAAAGAGCGLVVLLCPTESELAGQADLTFPDVAGLLRYLRLVRG